MTADAAAIYFLFAAVVWPVPALIVAAIASGKFRPGLGWFLFGSVIWPVALIWVLCLPARSPPDLRPRRACPHCAERILAAARVCPYCRSVVA